MDGTLDKAPLSRAERHPEKAHRPDNPIRRKPEWIRVRAPNSPEYAETKRLMRQYGLATVCEEAACPNIGECWKHKHATFMIMGDTCTRACAFCNVATGKPGALNPHEPENIAEAVGIVGNVENLGLEGTKVKVDKTHIVIDQWGFTGEPNVYAIGDVAGPPWLAHKAMHEGVLVVEKIAGVKGVHPMKTENIPGCTYCQPQVASIGMTEAVAKAKGLQVKVGKFPFIGNGKAIALGEPEGFIKTIFDAKTGELLGAHMIGAEVTELIQGYSVAKTLETTEAELMATVFPHPTLSEMMHESVLAAYGRTLHI